MKRKKQIMSNINSDFWENLIPSIEIDYFQDWLTMENFLGEFGEPGFSNVTKNIRWPSINPDSPLPIVFTCYRGDDGQLLGIFANYMMEGIQKPFLIIVHPDHQRTGIGSMLADYVVDEFESSNGHDYLFKESWGDAKISESCANWANKYVKKFY
jgi:ribosomal protein S18 acetylase RimI-like enzyme